MNNPIDDFIDVDYFTFQNIKGELMWTDNKEIFKWTFNTQDMNNAKYFNNFEQIFKH